MLPSPFDAIPVLYLAKGDVARCGFNFSAFVEPEHLLDAARHLLEKGYHLEDIAGLDTCEGVASVYHFDHFTTPQRIVLRAMMPHATPFFPSISSIYPGAEWHERETQDFYGFRYTNITNPRPLLIDFTMVDLHPLSKDENNRRPIAQLLSCGDQTVLFCDASFTFMNAPDEEKPAAPLSPVEGTE